MITITDGNITLDGVHIGAIKGDNAELLRPIGPKVKGEINSLHGSKLSFFVQESDGEGEGGESSSPAPSSAPSASDSPPPLGAPIAPPEPSVSLVETPQPAAPTRAEKLAPFLHLKDPAMGDKTPAFVEAARGVLTPEEFKAQYGLRTIPESSAAFEQGEARRHGKLPNEKEDKGA